MIFLLPSSRQTVRTVASCMAVEMKKAALATSSCGAIMFASLRLVGAPGFFCVSKTWPTVCTGCNRYFTRRRYTPVYCMLLNQVRDVS